MATKKASTKSTKKSTSSRATAAKKTTVKKTTTAVAARVATVKTATKSALFPANLPNIILAELVGTFILTLVAFGAFAASPFMLANAGVFSWLVDPLFVGLTLAVLVFAVGAVSGAHVNPAVTFGFWTMRRLKTVMVPVYWLSQFLGALLAVGVVNVMTSGQFAVNLNGFTSWNTQLFFIELLGMTLFMFGVAAVVSRAELSAGAKALGVGLSLTIGLVASVSMLTVVQKADYTRYSNQLKNVKSQEEADAVKKSRSWVANSAVLNPAVALAVKEDHTVENRISQATPDESVVQPSRFGTEVIFGTLLGAALGGNLYLLVAFRPKQEA